MLATNILHYQSVVYEYSISTFTINIFNSKLKIRSLITHLVIFVQMSYSFKLIVLEMH